MWIELFNNIVAKKKKKIFIIFNTDRYIPYTLRINAK